MTEEPPQVSGSIKAVTLYEIIKGVGAILIALALWSYHSQVLVFIDDANQAWVTRFGNLFEVQVDSLTRLAQRGAENWQLFMLIIFGYAGLRFIEAYGLWRDKTWAYWFSLLGYGLFLPLEFYYVIVRPFDWFKLGVLILNIVVVYVVYRQMRHKGLIS
ncbi:DUF2127 domain-containing protein [Psychrobacter sp. FDAARGOS_221]|uniref:DUF2127 domain-containing protein n=1 Tax=Psychrobacter sp. FDAARGOS_221 TaxID=1975705 RepID=UPI000BB57C7E|nr:DUF2127 domain-containing protein [Psychrobacter sp. FDAARGOS_221]PNK61305.1 DUF2127 domain-containing protein [Psychrobacter sp. FDAARGOS_221]